MSENWKSDLSIGEEIIDNAHQEVFDLTTMLDNAINENSRDALDPIINFLESHVIDHFHEEEDIMSSINYSDSEEHRQDHAIFQVQVAELRRLFDEEKHTTHLVYRIRQFVDKLIYHIGTVDIKLAKIKNTHKGSHD
ncbi:hemerythrin family protein [bacterium]|jgi:hemerythrin|nr:hemerythrin family protein [bacterium]